MAHHPHHCSRDCAQKEFPIQKSVLQEGFVYDTQKTGVRGGTEGGEREKRRKKRREKRDSREGRTFLQRLHLWLVVSAPSLLYSLCFSLISTIFIVLLRVLVRFISPLEIQYTNESAHTHITRHTKHGQLLHPHIPHTHRGRFEQKWPYLAPFSASIRS